MNDCILLHAISVSLRLGLSNAAEIKRPLLSESWIRPQPLGPLGPSSGQSRFLVGFLLPVSRLVKPARVSTWVCTRPRPKVKPGITRPSMCQPKVPTFKFVLAQVVVCN